MHKCAGIKPNDGRCERIVSSEQTYCYSHDPSRESERRRNAARGGKAKAHGEIGQVKARLQALADMVLEGTLDRGDAAVVGQIWGTYIRAIGMELKVKEVTELEERLEELEQLVGSKKGRPWGA
jgi:hypothetical protein